jgi:hypothetical protein
MQKLRLHCESGKKYRAFGYEPKRDFGTEKAIVLMDKLWLQKVNSILKIHL